MGLRRLVLVFPGQGSQRVGMGKDLVANWPRLVGDVLEEASEMTGLSLQRIMTQGPADDLRLTHVAQPALLSLSVAVLRVLKQEMELPSVHFALGHSLGEYSALVATESIDFANAVRLVHLRGLAMQRAVAPGIGAMAALMPVQPKDAEALCREAAASTGKVCQVANYNSRKQTVISGDARAVNVAISEAKATKKARRAVLLDVSAPFHCALMEPAKVELHEHLQQLLRDNKLHEPKVPVVWNVEAEATTKTPEEIAQVLEQQIVHAVRWSDSIDYCVDKGVNHFLELGVGGVLCRLIQQQTSKSNIRTTSCGTIDEVKTFLESGRH